MTERMMMLWKVMIESKDDGCGEGEYRAEGII